MTPLERADRARELLENSVLKSAFHDIRMRYVEQLEQVPMSDVETQHEVALCLQLLKRLQTTLQKYVADGAVEKAKQKQDSWIEKMRERFIA